MRELYWMGGPTHQNDPNIPPDAPQNLAYVWAETPEQAIAEARRIGICDDDVGDDQIDWVDGGPAEHIPERFIGRLLSRTDRAELRRLQEADLRRDAEERLDQLMLKLDDICDELDFLVVAHNRRKHGLPPEEPITAGHAGAMAKNASAQMA